MKRFKKTIYYIVIVQLISMMNVTTMIPEEISQEEQELEYNILQNEGEMEIKSKMKNRPFFLRIPTLGEFIKEADLNIVSLKKTRAQRILELYLEDSGDTITLHDKQGNEKAPVARKAIKQSDKLLLDTHLLNREHIIESLWIRSLSNDAHIMFEGSCESKAYYCDTKVAQFNYRGLMDKTNPFEYAFNFLYAPEVYLTSIDAKVTNIKNLDVHTLAKIKLIHLRILKIQFHNLPRNRDRYIIAEVTNKGNIVNNTLKELEISETYLPCCKIQVILDAFPSIKELIVTNSNPYADENRVVIENSLNLSFHTRLTKLKLISTNLSTLDFRNLNLLQSLDLTNNKFKTLDLEKNICLNSIEVQDNDISDITFPNSSFSSICIINLSNNYIPPGFITKLFNFRKLYSLYLSGNTRITIDPELYHHCRKYKTYTLVYNKVEFTKSGDNDGFNAHPVHLEKNLCFIKINQITQLNSASRKRLNQKNGIPNTGIKI